MSGQIESKMYSIEELVSLEIYETLHLRHEVEKRVHHALETCVGHQLKARNLYWLMSNGFHGKVMRCSFSCIDPPLAIAEQETK